MMNGKSIDSAEIVTIGTEMLLGDLVDTTTAWLSGRLAALGVSVYRHTTVGDNKQRIVAALREVADRADLVITTGGLGPTSDDLTNECLGLVAGRVVDEGREACPVLFETVEAGQVCGGVSHPQGMGVASLREPQAGEGLGVLDRSVRVRVVLHAADCRIRR